MPHVMVIIDLFILVAIVWAFSENNRQLKLLKKALIGLKTPQWLTLAVGHCLFGPPQPVCARV